MIDNNISRISNHECQNHRELWVFRAKFVCSSASACKKKKQNETRKQNSIEFVDVFRVCTTFWTKVHANRVSLYENARDKNIHWSNCRKCKKAVKKQEPPAIDNAFNMLCKIKIFGFVCIRRIKIDNVRHVHVKTFYLWIQLEVEMVKKWAYNACACLSLQVESE